MIEWFQSLSSTQWLGIAGVLLVAVLNRRPIMDAVKSVLPAGGVIDITDEDAAAFKAAMLLKAKFTKAGCEAGVKAARDCLHCLLDDCNTTAGS